MKNTILALLGFTLFLFSCSKDSEETPGPGAMVIVSFTSTHDTIEAWTDTASLKMTATGSGLSYEWKANHGTLRAFGDSAIYFAGDCCVGCNTITCTVSDSLGSDARELQVVVLRYHPGK